KWQSDLRMDIQSSDHAAVKGLQRAAYRSDRVRALQRGHGAVQAPLERSRAEVMAGGGELERRGMEDAHLLLGLPRRCNDLLSLVAIGFQRDRHAIAFMQRVEVGEDDDRYGVVEVGGECLAVGKGTEVFHVRDEARLALVRGRRRCRTV